MTQLNITERDEGERRHLILSGPVNSYTYTDLQEKLAKALSLGSLVIVEMEKVTNLSSAGIGVLMTALDEAEASDKRLVLLKPSEISRLALESTGFADRFAVASSLREL